MKKLLAFISLAIFMVACSSDSDTPTQPEQPAEVENKITEAPSVMPYSCDITDKGIVVVYKVAGAAVIDIQYKSQGADDWSKADFNKEDDTVTVTLTELKKDVYYYVMVIVKNDLGQSATDYFAVQYAYDAENETYFAQPFLQWGALVSNVKTAMADRGNILVSEVMLEDGLRLTYRFMYKELRTEYYFDEEKHLREVVVYFDKNRVKIDDLRRYVSSAFGYLSFGNIHMVIDGEDKAHTLLKTAEGASYVILYERGDNYIVDYLSTADVNLDEPLVK